MKKITSLLLAAGMLVGATQAQAADISVSGLFRVTGELKDNAGLAADADLDPTFVVKERFEISLNVKVSEAVSGVFTARMPNAQQWSGSHGDVAVTLRNAYMQFPVAGLMARVGYQLPALPKIASGANAYSRGWTSLPGVALVGNYGKVMPSLSWWIQGATAVTVDGSSVTSETSTHADSIVLQLPIAIADGMKLTPWAAANMYKESGYAASASSKPTLTTFGASFDANVNDLNAGLGVIAAMSSFENQEVSTVIAANVAMDLGALTPGLAVWYGLGGTNTTVAHWGGFNGANDTLYGNGGYLQSGFSQIPTAKSPISSYSPFQTLGVQANVADVALGDNATFGAHVLYVMGMESETDAANYKFANDDKSILEVGGIFSTKIAQVVTGAIEANYVMPMGDGNELKGNGFTVAGTLNMPF